MVLVLLPVFPVRVACESLANNMTGDDQVEEWLAGLAAFAGVYYNYTETLLCNTMLAPVNKESQIVVKNDMYWDDPWDGDAAAKGCVEVH
jgi:hypothetical protein